MTGHTNDPPKEWLLSDTKIPPSQTPPPPRAEQNMGITISTNRDSSDISSQPSSWRNRKRGRTRQINFKGSKIILPVFSSDNPFAIPTRVRTFHALVKLIS